MTAKPEGGNAKLSVKIYAPDDERDEWIGRLQALTGPANSASSCLSCRVLQDLGKPNQLILEQEWKTAAELAHHLREHQYEPLLEILRESTRRPVVAMYELVPRGAGIDLLAAMAIAEPGSIDTSRWDAAEEEASTT